MIEKKTVVNQIEIQPSGTVMLRLEKLLIEDGVVISSQYHRTSFEPGDDVDAQMRRVNAHLLQMKAEPCTDYQGLKAHVAIAHTPERIAAFRKNRDQSALPASPPSHP